jgi:glycosyltransferase involved in cell wall biosynthesis
MANDSERGAFPPAEGGSRPGVLMVGNFLSATAGLHCACEDLAARLPQRGWRVIRTSDRPGRLARLADMAGTAWRERGRYSVAQVDVYSGPAFVWAEVACAVLRRAGRPYVLTLRGGKLPEFAARNPGRVRRLLRSAAAVTTPSGFLMAEMRPYRGDLLLVPNALDVAAYPVRTGPPGSRLAWLRSFLEFYNPQLAVQVVARLAPEFPEVSLVMVGPDRGDGSMDRTRALSAELGVAERVSFPGGVFKAEVPARLSQADIFLNTTRVDNTPVSVIEAMACGLCVVSTDVGGLSYLVENERDALLVPSDDPEAMTAAVARVLRDPELAARLAANARRKVEGFDWGRVLPEWDRLLRSVAGAGAASRAA